MSAGIGGMASSHHPDTSETNTEAVFNKAEPQQQQQKQQHQQQQNAQPLQPQLQPNLAAQPSSASVHSNAPLLSVLHRDSNTATSTLQFESASGLLDDLEDSDDDLPRTGEKRSGRRKIKIEYIEDKSRRHITFSKRKAGIMKKAYELSTLTGTQVLLLVASETGHVYTFATPKLQPLITKQEGKNLIQACLNSPDHHNSAIPEYMPMSGASSNAHHYDNDLGEDDLAPRSTSTAAIQSAYHQSGTTPTPQGGSSAASVAAAAAQVFMNSSHPSQYAASYQQSSNNGSYWNGAGASASAGAMFAPAPAKSNVQQQQSQQQHQQQQMYHALLQQQQLYQQYQQQQQQQQQMNKSSNDQNE